MPTVMLLLFVPKSQMKATTYAQIFGGSTFDTFYNMGNQEQTAKETCTTASEALRAISCIRTKFFSPSMPNPQSRIPPSCILTHYNCISPVASAQIEAQTVPCAKENSFTGQIKKRKKNHQNQRQKMQSQMMSQNMQDDALL